MNHLASVILLFSACVTVSAAVVTIDAPRPNSVMLEDFSAPVDSSSEQRNGIRFLSAENGVTKYSVAKVLDPQLFFDGYLEPVDFSSFPHVRIRHAFSGQAKGGSVYPMPVREGQLGKILVNDTLTGRQVTLEQFSRSGDGLRLDPVDGPPVAGEYWIDYIILDRGRTLGFEFDEKNSTRGGLNNYFTGNNLGGPNGKEILTGVDQGVFRGTPVNADPMMILQLTQPTGLTAINPEVYKFIEIRMRVLEPQQGVATIFFRNESGDMSVNKIEFTLVENEYFHTYLIDLRQDISWNAGKITNLRFDPTNQKQVFEIDSIRFYETAELE